MRILQVGTGFFSIPPNGAGAVETAVHNISKHLAERGHDIYVIDFARDMDRISPYKVKFVFSHVGSHGKVEHVLSGIGFGLMSSFQIFKLLKREKFDVVHFNNQFSGLWGIRVARHFGVPSVYTVHSAAWGLGGEGVALRNRFTLGQEIVCMKSASRVIVVSEYLRERITNCLGVDTGKVAVVPNGVDTDVFKPSICSSNLRDKVSPRGEIVILNVARIAPYKNQMALLKAFGLLSEKNLRAKLLFVGPIDDRAYFSEIQKVIFERKLRDSVTIFGQTSFLTLLQLYSLADIVVLPSITEGLPLAVLEAMACGKAIIASNIGPNKELLDGIGVLVDPCDEKCLASSLSSLIEDPRTREKMGNQARTVAMKDYTWDAITKRVEQVYTELSSASYHW